MQTTIDGVFCFDTTGSMSPCIQQVRRQVRETCSYLLENIPNLRLGILSHGDWCDGGDVISQLDLVSIREADILDNWIKNCPDTCGGDYPECYEYALYKLRTEFNWNSNIKFVVMIGDAIPHEGEYYRHRPFHKFDGGGVAWEYQLSELNNNNIQVYPVQALGNRSSNYFWQDIADKQNLPKLTLEQFSDINQILTAVCMQQSGQLDKFIDSISAVGASHNVLDNLDKLSGKKTKRKRKVSKYSKDAVHPSRFQILKVKRDTPIKDFVENNRLKFKTGRGFYQFTKRVNVQDYKEVVIRDNTTGEMFSGDKAREILGIPIGVTAKVAPSPSGQYTGFVQSTSNNRKLLGGTEFLYEVEEFS